MPSATPPMMKVGGREGWKGMHVCYRVYETSRDTYVMPGQARPQKQVVTSQIFVLSFLARCDAVRASTSRCSPLSSYSSGR